MPGMLLTPAKEHDRAQRERERETDRQTDRQRVTERERERAIHGERGSERERERERVREKETEKKRERRRERGQSSGTVEATGGPHYKLTHSSAWQANTVFLAFCHKFVLLQDIRLIEKILHHP